MWTSDLGRAARVGQAQGVPAQVLAVALWHTASTGLELWLSAVAAGARHVAVLATHEEAPQYLEMLEQQMAVAQAILHGLGYAGTHFSLLRADAPQALDEGLQRAARTVGAVPAAAARFAVSGDKRPTIELALDHLMEQAPADPRRPQVIELPATGSPLGAIAVDKNACTLCLSCVSACPASALQDNPDLPQLRFIEKNCVQCGLCASTCPEDAITLQPRLMLTPERKQAKMNEYQERYKALSEEFDRHQRELARAEQTATADIMKRLVELASRIAQEKGYAMVVEKSAVVFAAPALEMTDELIRRFDGGRTAPK